MSFAKVPTGKNAPEDIYVIIENPMRGDLVKYEVDKDMDALIVDRFTPTPMVFPAHYGYINNTLAGDGDPVDAFVWADVPVIPGSVIRARPVAVLITEDESGEDAKILCMPHEKVDRRFKDIKDLEDVDQLLKDQLEHFYQNYKALEKGKWVKVSGWQGALEAKKLIEEGIAAYKG